MSSPLVDSCLHSTLNTQHARVSLLSSYYYVSSHYYACVLILLSMCPHTTLYLWEKVVLNLVLKTTAEIVNEPLRYALSADHVASRRNLRTHI
jgi:hypothetical protein